jgi:hypothetical protein
MSLLVGLLFILLIFLLVLAASALAQPTREYGVKSITAKGEAVRSRAEQRIADYFTEHSIRYVYERDVRARSFFHSYRIAKPDIFLPDYNVYVEYWGLVDADDQWTRQRYVKNMKRKMAIYHRHNIRFISIYPSNLDNLDWIFRTKFKKVMGFELPA